MILFFRLLVPPFQFPSPARDRLNLLLPLGKLRFRVLGIHDPSVCYKQILIVGDHLGGEKTSVDGGEARVGQRVGEEGGDGQAGQR